MRKKFVFLILILTTCSFAFYKAEAEDDQFTINHDVSGINKLYKDSSFFIKLEENQEKNESINTENQSTLERLSYLDDNNKLCLISCHRLYNTDQQTNISNPIHDNLLSQIIMYYRDNNLVFRKKNQIIDVKNLLTQYLNNDLNNDVQKIAEGASKSDPYKMHKAASALRKKRTTLDILKKEKTIHVLEITEDKGNNITTFIIHFNKKTENTKYFNYLINAFNNILKNNVKSKKNIRSIVVKGKISDLFDLEHND